ncbi:sensor histidine kinase [Kribbella antiqua]|uniref:sensor histidine kinase n=1 Tax=Kribbella antiqua TaxID=2512217 RepID=UPI00104EF6EB|nr:histidine kinase [Kribbella antiqua]
MVDLERYAERNPWLTDAVIVTALAGGAVLGLTLVGPGESRPDNVWDAALLTGLACLTILRGRGHARTAVVVTTLCAVVTGSLGYLLTPLLLAPVMVALYWLAATTTPRTSWTFGGIATAAVVATAVGLDNFDEMVALRALGPALWLLLPLALGSSSRLRRAYVDAVHARAEYAERTREEEARLRVSEERLRIARDLHDIMAHHMAVAHAHAGTAAHLLDTNPQLTKAMLADLQATTTKAMLDLRDTVGVLRTGGVDDESLEPTPGLAKLPDLLTSCRSAGLEVACEVEGEPQELPSGIDLSAYRIIQEALTNATKHSSTGGAQLNLYYGNGALTITIGNSRSPSAPPRSKTVGFGLTGMQERAQAVGGHLTVNDVNPGTFEVVTTLPLQTHAAPLRLPTIPTSS